MNVLPLHLIMFKYKIIIEEFGGGGEIVLRRDRMVVGLITTYMLSVPITITVMSSNPAQARCTGYNIM